MSEQANAPPVNPYESMSAESIKKHLEMVAKTIKEKKVDVDVRKEFGLTDDEKKVSEELRKQVTDNEKFLAGMKQVLVDANVIKDEKQESEAKVDPTVERIVQKTVDDVAGEIRGYDKDIPLDGILNSDRSAVEKLDILGYTKDVAAHFKGIIDGYKKTIDESSKSNEKFTVSGGSQSNDWSGFLKGQQDMVNKMIKTEEN